MFRIATNVAPIKVASRLQAAKFRVAFSNKAGSSSQNANAKLGVAIATGAAAISLATLTVASLEDDALHPPHYPWDHQGLMSSFDHKAIRRGHQVYTQVCAACHSLELVAFNSLVGVCFSEQEVKNMAAEVDVQDGPDDTGEMFERPGKLSDHLPSPYRNEEEGSMANNGAYPPDLSLMIKARHGKEDYVFSLLTGYREPPEGISLREGLHYNPYFPGGAISMAKQLQNGGVEYEDGTPATECQMARDVATFLAWAAEPEHDDRKRQGIKWLSALVLFTLITGYYKRSRFSIYKARQISYTK